jgi:hypothetical protein
MTIAYSLTPTTRDKLICAQRELEMRRNVYPGRIEQGKMTQAQATYEIKCMEAICDDYRSRDELESDFSDEHSVL